MRQTIVSLVATLFLALAVAPVGAQSRARRVEVVPPGVDAPPASDTSQTSPDEPVALEGDLIEVPVVVADRSGHYVPSLRKQDFELLEDNRPQDVTFFRSERVPIHVALLLDTSLSTRFALDDIQSAAIDFVNRLLPGDEIMIVSFAGQVTIEQEFTSDRRLLTAAVRGTTPTWGTRLYEAVYRTVGERMRSVDGRKAIVILSDGQDVGSAVSADQAVNACSESDVAVYGVRYPRASDLRRQDGGDLPGTRDNRSRRFPRFPSAPRFPGSPWPFVAEPEPAAQRGRGRGFRDPFMETVARDSGGTLYDADAISDIGGLFAKIAEELRHVYVLGYAPSNPLSTGGHRTISVRVPSRPDLAVRHRLGYDAGARP